MKGRLDKIIASCCLLSRKEAQLCIRGGRVQVKGAVCPQTDAKCDTETDGITLDGRPVGGDGYAYVMLHKPTGVLSATEDKRLPTVLQLLPPQYHNIGLGVVGRLDIDTEGLLLLTNNGELNHRLTSPRHHVDKLYLAVLDGPAQPEDVDAFASGMDLGDFQAMPAQLTITEEPSRCLVVIREGKFHQVKRMFAKVGRQVTHLKRLRMGPLALDAALECGAWRPLTAGEIAELLETVGIV